MSNIGTTTDVVIYKASPVLVQCGVFTGLPSATTLSSITGWTAATLKIRKANERGQLLLQKILSPSDFNTIIWDDWSDGSDQHFTFSLSETDTNQTVPSDGTLEIYGVISVTIDSTDLVVGHFQGVIRNSGLSAGTPTTPEELFYNQTEIDALLAAITSAPVSVRHTDGTTTTYQLDADTDLARGEALEAACEALEEGESISIGTSQYKLTAAELVLKNGSSILSNGATILFEATSGTHNIFTDGGAPVTMGIYGDLTIIGHGTAGSPTIHGIYATGDGSQIHVASTVRFNFYTSTVPLTAIQVSDGATVYADSCYVEVGKMVVGSGGVLYHGNARPLFVNYEMSGGKLYIDGTRNEDGMVVATGGTLYARDVHLVGPEGEEALVLSGATIAELDGRFEANGTNNPALLVGPSTNVTIVAGSTFLHRGTAKAIAASSGNPTIRLTGPISCDTVRDSAITYTHATAEVGGLKEETQAATTFFGNSSGISAAPTFMNALQARTALSIQDGTEAFVLAATYLCEDTLLPVITCGDGNLNFDNFGAVVFNTGKAALFRTGLELATVAATGSASDIATGTLPDARLSANIATTAYVDAHSSGLQLKTECVVLATGNITLSGEQTINGVLTSASRVLVPNQTAPEENGIYVSAAGAWSRASDMNSWAEVPGAFTFVTGGTLFANTGWSCSSTTGGTLGTTPITWVQFSSAGAYSNGTGLLLAGTVFSADFGTSSGKVSEGNHTHAASVITSGTITFARLPTGTSSSTVAIGDHQHFSTTTASVSGSVTPSHSGLTKTIKDYTVTGNITAMNSPGGSPVTGQILELNLLLSGGAWTISGWNAIFALGDNTPTIPTTSGKMFTMLFEYSALKTKWLLRAVSDTY